MTTNEIYKPDAIESEERGYVVESDFSRERYECDDMAQALEKAKLVAACDAGESGYDSTEVVIYLQEYINGVGDELTPVVKVTFDAIAMEAKRENV